MNFGINIMNKAPLKNNVRRLADGSVIMAAVPLIANQDLQYYAFELPFELVGDIPWDTPLVGRLTQEAAENSLNQFKGLPLTDGHEFIEVGDRDSVAVGAFLQNATLDGDKVTTEALVYGAKAIVKVTSESELELSIGAYSDLEWNSLTPKKGEPNFYIRTMEMNHVALVKEGRAGPEARLLNHKATLEKITMAKITIGGVEHEVPDAVATDHARLTTENATLTNSVSTLTGERDTANGQLAAANSEIATLKAVDVNSQAAKIANSHAEFATQAATLGHKDELKLGEYDQAKVMRTILENRGAKLPDDASAEFLGGAWSQALVNTAASGKSAIDPTGATTTTAEIKHDAAERAFDAVNASYFGGKKEKA